MLIDEVFTFASRPLWISQLIPAMGRLHSKMVLVTKVMFKIHFEPLKAIFFTIPGGIDSFPDTKFNL